MSLSSNTWKANKSTKQGYKVNLIEPVFNIGWVKVQGIWKPNFEWMGARYDPKLVLFNGKGKYSDTNL